MTQEELTYLIIILASILIGVIIFFLACIFYVKKDTVIIIEKVEKFFGVYEHGFHFFWPFVYRRRGTYPTGVTNKNINLANGKKVKVTYKIFDIIKYHYAPYSIEKLFNNLIIKEEKVSFDLLKNELSMIGIELINIQQIIN